MWQPISSYGIPRTELQPPIAAYLGDFLVFDPEHKFETEDGTGIFIAFYAEVGREWLTSEGGLKLSPTHFMPLPAAPTFGA